MEKRFNITGLCVPEKHYMVDTSAKMELIGKMIERGDYFTINRARQFGKTTLLNGIRQKFSDRYLVIDMSFEGIGGTPFESQSGFVSTFCALVVKYLEFLKIDGKYLSFWKDSGIQTINDLSSTISEFCKNYPLPVILMIDEVDKSSDNQMFLDFIGMLRNKYLDRDKGNDATFHNVVLAGVYDVKNLKLKLRPNDEKKFNSPWNIAADFNVEMEFNPQEISTMLSDYENDIHTGMDIMAISNEIYRFTSGYPFLVSKVCKLIDEDLDKMWTIESVRKAVNRTVKSESTLFDDLTKNLELYPDYKRFIYSVLMNSDGDVVYEQNNPIMRLGKIFSIIKPDEEGKVMIHNLIFEQVLYNYFIAEEAIRNSSARSYRSNFIENGKLLMDQIVSRFQFFMHEEYRTEDERFIERQGRLLFLSFLKPIINGSGFYYVEPQTRENSRMDLVVTYGGEEFVIELRIWHGQKYETEGKIQLSEYLNVRGLDKGYLVTFDFSKNKIMCPACWVDFNGKQIFEAII